MWKTRFVAGESAMFAIVIGWWIANGSYALPMITVGVGLGACLVALLGLSFDTIVLGGLLVGYIAGNRGFAQISLMPGLPLLPAESGLALCILWLIVRSAHTKEVPLRRNALNIAVLLWLVIGGARIIPDIRARGVMAVRDFAMIYYALFFFVAQDVCANPRARQFLGRCLLIATLALLPLSELFRRFPDFFLNRLTIGGTPIIYFKGDLVATFIAAGALLTFERYRQSHRVVWLLLVLLGMLAVLASESRAALVGLGVATMWLVLGGRRKMLWLQLGSLALVGLGMMGGFVTGHFTSRDTAAYRVYERVLSIADVGGQRVYDSAEVEFKGDNNRFRLVWWRAVIEETVDGDPWLGLGFGYDLAAEFLHRYYPDNSEDFSTRSPHSILITAFGRMGVIGLLTLLAIVASLARETHRALLRATSQEDPVTYWLVGWVIFISACFGVVLEGPMGAVVFWTVLGMASAASAPAAATEETAPALVENGIHEGATALVPS